MQVTTNVTINLSLTVTVTILMIWNTYQTHDTKVTVEEKTESVDSKVNKTIAKINELGNTTALSDKQIIQIVKQILREID